MLVYNGLVVDGKYGVWRSGNNIPIFFFFFFLGFFFVTLITSFIHPSIHSPNTECRLVPVHMLFTFIPLSGLAINRQNRA